jgi:predicted molibdopterin-dependent oxidoreductase YjgC
MAVKDGRMVGIRGRATDVVNHGRLGPKSLYGSTPWAASADRLTRPLIRQDGRLVEKDWTTAMNRIVSRSGELLASTGPLSQGFHTSGQLFLEEYFTLGNKRRTADQQSPRRGLRVPNDPALDDAKSADCPTGGSRCHR